MKISRAWAMPSRWTFDIPPIKELLKGYVGNGKGWIDPFCGNSYLAELRNDLNAGNKVADYHIEAVDFLATLRGEYKGCLYDPPYSLRQVKECYNKIGYSAQETNYTLTFIKIKKRIAELILPGGYVVSCGWNTVGIGRRLGFHIKEILLICHGGYHNDTIVTVEQKDMQGRLF